ncbi:HK97 gp10 family phage protein [Clostridium sp. KNHs216]|uniref:HK97 gp10 family phage protein n=1 Tax=Clostridium sp. KNHs216 TaxID=1550235 RepID=UPI001152583A|nr:HK97 gp10 family phage protein [Clostridium sp. KNHs216]TQI69002.1 bacteriophage HK97-gp10 putative tail-component [Clostridium sp. KNHs216]
MSTMDFSTYMAALKQLGADLDESAQRTLSRMNAKGMEITIKNTPVGQYPKGSGKVGGTLRKNWHNGGTRKVGNGHESRYYNNVYYSGYVNNGHRLVNHRHETVGYVEGRRMLEQGQEAAKEAAPAIFNEEIQRVKQKGGW